MSVIALLSAIFSPLFFAEILTPALQISTPYFLRLSLRFCGILTAALQISTRNMDFSAQFPAKKGPENLAPKISEGRMSAK